VVNYPVQGFGNDLVQLACVRAHRRFKETHLKSLLILTVHDSIVIDTHPDEVTAVNQILEWAMVDVLTEAQERWGHTFILPLKIEGSSGVNWLMD
jgi:DNA polymerase-1